MATRTGATSEDRDSMVRQRCGCKSCSRYAESCSAPGSQRVGCCDLLSCVCCGHTAGEHHHSCSGSGCSMPLPPLHALGCRVRFRALRRSGLLLKDGHVPQCLRETALQSFEVLWAIRRYATLLRWRSQEVVMTILGNMLQPLQGRGKAQKAPPHLVPAALRRRSAKWTCGTGFGFGKL
jgi:hypothetical protein